MATIKKHNAKKAVAKKAATRGKDKVLETYDCGCYRPIIAVDACGCVETQCCC
jgi:hypothetical protein